MQLDFFLSASQLNILRSGAAIVPDRAAVLRVEGPGAIDCLQGLLTCDIVALGVNRLTYGAVLTGKGMIVLDPFVLRDSQGMTLVLPGFARETALQHFARVIPPRLARVTDQTGDCEVVWLFGEASLGSLAEVMPDLPELEPALVIPFEGAGDRFAVGTALMPFAGLLVAPANRAGAFVARARAHGMTQGDESWIAAARVLAGWPTLGREIDEKTFPQEVRYDELGAVSYTKGCYTGQETVARVHFRGHPNRTLRGIVIEAGEEAPIPESRVLCHSGKDAGVLRTAIHLENRTFALATIRRDVPDEAVLALGERQARPVPLPFTQEVAV